MRLTIRFRSRRVAFIRPQAAGACSAKDCVCIPPARYWRPASWGADRS